jgi:hypothetical protein
MISVSPANSLIKPSPFNFLGNGVNGNNALQLAYWIENNELSTAGLEVKAHLFDTMEQS